MTVEAFRDRPAGDEKDPRLRRTQVTCILTRIELAHWWQVPLIHLHHRRVRRSLAESEEPLTMSLLRESARVYYTLSLWSKPYATVASATTEHVKAVGFGRRASWTTWSTQWHLTRLSSSSYGWPGSSIDWPRLACESGAAFGHAAAFRYCDGDVTNLQPEWARRPTCDHEHDHR
jgi:hypothetical protein